MASTSSSSTSNWKYDVFLSFRGKDTRDSFLSHLYTELCHNQIETFMDDKLGGGEEITPALLKTIQESNISVVVFSKNYADSPWCLDELEKILECKEKLDQKVLPVFYQVDPTHVQKLTGSFGDALVVHQQQFSLDKVERWGHALKEIANLKGWDSHNIKPESILIQEIVNDILKKLEHLSSSSFDDLDNFDGLIGIDSRVKDVESLLFIGSPEMCIVGIWGMGGIGKTTIAEAVFSGIATQFEGRCFLLNVREKSDKHPLVYLRHEILSTVLEKENLNIGTINFLPLSTRKMLQKKNVLIVLDDMDSSKQLKELVGDRRWYGLGSRIIVTSRDKQVLKNGCDQIYEVKKLDHQEALKLFQLHAFKQTHFLEGYLEMSKRVVNYVDGVPLALKVLGCDLYKKSIREWESKVAKLEEIPDKEINKVLRISYDALDRNEQSVFLDIACFFKGCVKDYVERILGSCGFFAIDGIRHLSDKSLITISNNTIEMHDLIQQMGQDIVREECINEPGKCSRLWFHKDICHVLTKQTGTSTVEIISLNTSMLKEIHLHPTTFNGMYNLRLLKFQNYYSNEIKVYLPEGLEYLPDELRVLVWDAYPLKFLPSNFCPKNLVELIMCDSRVKQLWDGVQPNLANLKILDLSNSLDLSTVPDFSNMPNLEKIHLRACRSLVEVPVSIQCCSKLTNLDLDGCENLCSFPSCPHLPSAECFDLSWCAKITQFPDVSWNIKWLYLNETAIEQVPSSIRHLSQLRVLDLRSCKNLESLSGSIGQLECLEELSLDGCSKLASLPSSTCNLKSLKFLYLRDCLNLKGLPENLGNLESLKELRISNTSSVTKLPSSINQLSNLKTLSLARCGVIEIPDNLCSLVSLKRLYLQGNNFERLPASMKQLSRLETLDLIDCESLQHLPELPSSLKYLYANNCSSLTSAPNLFTENVRRLDVSFINCFKLADKGKIMDDAHAFLRLRLTASFRVCIPGSEVPQWFRHKASGCSLAVEEEPHSHYNGHDVILSWAFCVVLHCSAVSLAIDCACISEPGHVTHRTGFTTLSASTESEEDVKKHVFLWYDSRFGGSIKVASFYLNQSRHEDLDHLVIYKCGVHPIFVQDKNQSQTEEEKEVDGLLSSL